MGNERIVQPGRRLGRLPLKTTRNALNFSEFFNEKFLQLPRKSAFWARKPALPQRTFGNTEVGDCTRAKQAYASIRMERLERRRTIDITDEEVKRVYREGCVRNYGSDADNGMYEDDALNEWRNPETTFRDTDGHPLTIDAYLRINALNLTEVRAGLALSGAHGIAVCFNLPAAFAGMQRWDVPEGQALIGDFEPGTWGGHSMNMIGYDDKGEIALVDDTWGEGPREVTYRAMAACMDEAHLYIDSVDAWRKRTTNRKVRRALADVVEAVNAVSSIRIKE